MNYFAKLLKSQAACDNALAKLYQEPDTYDEWVKWVNHARKKCPDGFVERHERYVESVPGGRKMKSPRRRRSVHSRYRKRSFQKSRRRSRSKHRRRSRSRSKHRRRSRSRSKHRRRSRSRSKHRRRSRSRRKKWRPAAYRSRLKSSCFLDPKGRKYPVCDKNGRIVCQGVKAAKSRAALVAATRRVNSAARKKARRVRKKAQNLEKRLRCSP